MRYFEKWDTIIIRFLASYIVMLVIPSLLFILVYTQTVDMVEKDIKASNLSMLEQGRDILDKHLQEVDAMVVRVARNPKVNALTYMNTIDEGSADIDALINAADELSTYRLTNSFVKEFFIYFNKSDIIITDAAANTRMRLLYGRYFKFGDLSYREWISDIAGPMQKGRYIPSTNVTFNGREKPVITYLWTIPLEYPNINKGCIMAFIDAEAVNQLLKNINIGSDGYTYILDKDNTIITSISPNGKQIAIPDMIFRHSDGVMNTRIAGEDMVVSYTVSAFNGWKYVTLVPTSYVMTKVNYIRSIICYTALALLLVGLAISLFLTYKNAKPIRDIVDSLRELLGDSNKYKNEYMFLSGSISSLIDSNKDLGQKLSDQQPVIQADFLKRLLNGHFTDPAEIDTNLSHLGIRLSGARYVVLILKIHGYRDLINKNILKELDISRLVINQAICAVSDGRVASCDLDETSVALVVSFESAEPGEVKPWVEKMVETLYGELQNRSNIYTSFAAGSICASLVDIGYSYADAKQALDQSAAGKKKLVWYDEMPRQMEWYHYSVSMEKKLIDLVLSGESTELKKLLNIVCRENFTERKLPFRILKLFIYQFKGTLTRVAEQAGGTCPECLFEEMSHIEDVEYCYDRICKHLQEYCDAVNAKRSSSDDILEGKILSFLNTVYMKEDLTLYNVAAHFNLSETYLYHFFKEKKGTTFANYLEKLRMDNAYSLLTETDITISEIALKVGYSSVHSFRRAFKRCRGYIPSELRNA
jgi:AraC-like DNA-binding protein